MFFRDNRSLIKLQFIYFESHDGLCIDKQTTELRHSDLYHSPCQPLDRPDQTSVGLGACGPLGYVGSWRMWALALPFRALRAAI